MNVELTRTAESDIVAIGDWIAKDNPRRAVSFIIELRDSCFQIGDTPRGYVVVQRYLKDEIRRKPFRDYLIFYRIKENTVEILHVVRGSRDYSNLF